eukprot:1478575-Prymnesium_polylepis.1
MAMTGKVANSLAKFPPGAHAPARSWPKAAWPRAWTKGPALPRTFMTSWLPHRRTTRPPDASASAARLRSSIQHSSSLSPRSSTSPSCTSVASPPAHCRRSSIRPEMRRICTVASKSPCRSPIATTRPGLCGRTRHWVTGRRLNSNKEMLGEMQELPEPRDAMNHANSGRRLYCNTGCRRRHLRRPT